MTDDINFRLGEISGHMENLIKNQVIMDSKLSNVLELCSNAKRAGDKANERIDDLVEPDGMLTVAHERALDWHENKKRAMYVGATLAVLGGLGGTAVGDVIKSIGKLFSGDGA